MNYSYLDSYCERSGDAAMWAEPINAVTNIAFMAAAFMAVQSLRRTRFAAAPDAWILTLVLFCIGIGSLLWHVTPTATTVLLDVIPIVIFINLYLAAFLWRGFGYKWWQVLFAIAALQAMNVLAGIMFDPNTLHGTIMYLPTYGILVVMVAYAAYRRAAFAKTLADITLLWTVSLFFRTVDMPLCLLFPYGTHWLWHLCNAVVLYKLLALLVRVTPTTMR
jgi:Ceramidase